MARPGLTAHASAYRSAHRYRPSGTAHAGGGARVVPSRFSWINLGLEFVDPRLSIEDPGPSPADCELDCGEQRADCFREGGTRGGMRPGAAGVPLGLLLRRRGGSRVGRGAGGRRP
jgi:hypothetical protein